MTNAYVNGAVLHVDGGGGISNSTKVSHRLWR
jgi:hypothetical protein